MSEALLFAAARHSGQRRKGDGRPFITHPIAVARILKKEGLSESVVMAGLLHDVLEDTPTTPGQMERRFGKAVTRMVLQVTEPSKRYAWEVKKAAYLAGLKTASRGALAIACADKLHNTQSLLAVYEREGAAAFARFRRPIGKRWAYHVRVYETIRNAWPNCPSLGRLNRSLKKLEKVMLRYPDSEEEAKFLLEKTATARSLLSLKRLGPFKVNRRMKEPQRNLYLDTKDLALRRRHAALKLRRVLGESELTFKRETGYRDGVSKRVEVTVPVRKQAVAEVLSGKGMSDPMRRAKKLAGRKPLVQVLNLSTDRTRLFFSLGREQIELDLDRVKVYKGSRVVHSTLEVELENLNASVSNFRKALSALRGRFKGKLRASRASKYEIGLKAVGLI